MKAAFEENNGSEQPMNSFGKKNSIKKFNKVPILPYFMKFPISHWDLRAEGEGGGLERMSRTSSPQRSRGGNDSSGSGAEDPRLRFFDKMAKNLCWSKAETVPGRHPKRWRKDPAGNIVCKRFANCYGCLCFEYDHTIPFSRGGESTADNCQILPTRVNRFKSDKQELDKTQLRGYTCDIKFTDKELDIIEMAVYGDVARPGNQCRCRTVAEMLGQYKSKDRVAACKLPYGNEPL